MIGDFWWHFLWFFGWDWGTPGILRQNPNQLSFGEFWKKVGIGSNSQLLPKFFWRLPLPKIFRGLQDIRLCSFRVGVVHFHPWNFGKSLWLSDYSTHYKYCTVAAKDQCIKDHLPMSSPKEGFLGLFSLVDVRSLSVSGTSAVGSCIRIMIKMV